ncbi:serine protease inhibitor 42Dd-like [Drosophila hydei]|uniref:Serine protease inhibitor 42Dd-like n=1 Tax=Drosophila hydei TaxID=7224 RepID=A0A6J1LAR4_DROHY|nr:serine protease inhibitor 42Dd-like [Drosophila hydei]
MENLFLLYLGSDGETAAQIANFLQLKTDLSKGTLQLSLLEESYKSPISTANQFLLPQDVKILDSYRSLVDKANGISFASLKSLTSKKIFLLSSTYYKGLWQKKFKNELTKLNTFYMPQADGKLKKSTVRQMSDVGFYKYQYLSEVDAHIVEIPYNTNVSMFVLLPVNIAGINLIENNLHKLALKDIFPSKTAYIQIKLPMFKLESQTKLKEVIETLGVTQLFNNANLKSMTDYKKTLSLSKIIQTATIDVDESGSQTFLSDGAAFRTTSELFNVNHPFVFLISDKNYVYLAGRVASL